MKYNRYPIVVLCGSTTFKEEFLKVRAHLTLQGFIVLGPEVYSHCDKIELSEDNFKMLMDMHMKKIDMCDQIYVVNKDQHIGHGCKTEIDYAISKGKPVFYMEEVKSDVREE